MDKNTLKILLIASMLYILIGAIATLYSTYVLVPLNTQIATTKNSTLSNYVITPASGTQIASFELLALELGAITAVAVLELRLKLFSRLAKHIAFHLSKFINIQVMLAVLALAFYAGVLIFLYLFFGIIGVVIAIVATLLISKAKNIKFGMAELYVLISLMLIPTIFAPAIGLYTQHSTAWVKDFIVIGINIAWAVGALFFALNFTKFKNRQLAINLVAGISSIVFPLFWGIYYYPLITIAILGFFSVYDFVAVFITKHMQVLATMAMKSNVPALFIVGDYSQMEARLQQTSKPQNEQPVFSKAPVKQPERKVAALGAGDIILPGALIASVAIFKPASLYLMVIGGIGGMFANMILLESGRFRRGIPALPMIFAFMAFLYFI